MVYQWCPMVTDKNDGQTKFTPKSTYTPSCQDSSPIWYTCYMYSNMYIIYIQYIIYTVYNFAYQYKKLTKIQKIFLVNFSKACSKLMTDDKSRFKMMATFGAWPHTAWGTENDKNSLWRFLPFLRSKKTWDFMIIMNYHRIFCKNILHYCSRIMVWQKFEKNSTTRCLRQFSVILYGYKSPSIWNFIHEIIVKKLTRGSYFNKSPEKIIWSTCT